MSDQIPAGLKSEDWAQTPSEVREFITRLLQGVTNHTIEGKQSNSEAELNDESGSHLAGQQHAKVLVVDDNATNRLILSETLTNWGMKPTAVDGGLAALEEMKQAVAGEPFPLVITDAMMPEMDGFTLAEQIQQTPELASVTIMMLSSTDQHQNAARCRELGIDIYLTKPIKPKELLNAIHTCLDGQSLDVTRTSDAIPQPILETVAHLHILLAEDHPINQRLAVGILEKRGHTLVVADNGRLALDAVAQGNFDLVLMDVQMPEMDGFEATKAIRDREALATNGARLHVPIIALTANAMQGDRERCLTAGMDDYLSKPFTQGKLQAILAHWCPQRAEEHLSHDPAQDAAQDAATQAVLSHTQHNRENMRVSRRESAGPDRIAQLDPQPLAELKALGNPGILGKVIQRYTDHSPQLLRTLREAITADDAKAVQNAAHSLKSSSANVGATELAALSAQLEMMGREQNLDDAPRLLAETEAEYAAVQVALANELESSTPDTASHRSTRAEQLAA